MEHPNALGEFLRARRALVRPGELGISTDGRRKVEGLRREELSFLAGISLAYYVRLEQGRDQNPSRQVLDALARALLLDDDAAQHLRRLAAPQAPRRRRPSRPERVSPTLLDLLERRIDAPAFVLGRRLDVLAANELATALHPSFRQGCNLARAAFLDDGARAYYSELDRVLADTVGALRSLAGDDLEDQRLTELVGELSLKSAEFRRLWARHEIRPKLGGTKRFEHPLVGSLELTYDAFEIAGAARQTVIVYHARPGSPDERALKLIAGTPEARVGGPAPLGVS